MKAQNRQELLNKIINTIGDRKLYWFGTRGTDALPLLEIPQLSGVFSQIARLNSLNVEHDICLEDISGTRENLDAYDIDEDNSLAAREFLIKIRDCIKSPCIMIAYRPQKVIDLICFARKNILTRAMMPTVQQQSFDYKPWVEQSLSKLGVPIIPWEYYAENELIRLREKCELHRVVLRKSYSSGGSGVYIVNEPDDLGNIPISNIPQILAASELLTSSYSISVNAVAFNNGNITLHSPSVQILGHKDCTDLAFGFCGNDFGVIQELPNCILQKAEDITRKTGKWLVQQGYLGAFGVDLLVHKDNCYLAEINPRFLGSSQVGSRIDIENNRADMYLCHLAAYLGIEVNDSFNLTQLSNLENKYRHKVYHKKIRKESVFNKLNDNHLKLNVNTIGKTGCIINQVVENKSFSINNYMYI